MATATHSVYQASVGCPPDKLKMVPVILTKAVSSRIATSSI